MVSPEATVIGPEYGVDEVVGSRQRRYRHSVCRQDISELDVDHPRCHGGSSDLLHDERLANQKWKGKFILYYIAISHLLSVK